MTRPRARIVRLTPRRKIQQLIEEAKQLPHGERAELIEQLIAASAQEVDPTVEKAWSVEIARRIKEIESGKAPGVPLDAALAQMRKTVGL